MRLIIYTTFTFVRLSYFVVCISTHLLLRSCQDEIKREGIICLQEVSRTWAGKLHVDFARRGYHFVTGGRAWMLIVSDDASFSL